MDIQIFRNISSAIFIISLVTILIIFFLVLGEPGFTINSILIIILCLILLLLSQLSTVYSDRLLKDIEIKIERRGRPDILTVIATILVISGVFSIIIFILLLSSSYTSNYTSDPISNIPLIILGIKVSKILYSIYTLVIGLILIYVAYGFWNLWANSWNLAIGIIYFSI